MEHVSDMALLFVATVNIAIILATCVLNPGTATHKKKKNMMATIMLLSINLIFDVVCLVAFAWYGMAENGKIFVLFFPITGYLLYEGIKEVRAISR